MALATQCPHCFTIFRVANDQLKLRGGLVRCGSCKQVFNGEEYLVQAGVSDGLYHPAPGSKAHSTTGVAGVTAAPAPAARPVPATPPIPPSSLPEVNVLAPAVDMSAAAAPAPAAPAAPVTAPPVLAPIPAVEPIPLEAEPKVFRSPASPGYIPDLGSAHRQAPSALQDEPNEPSEHMEPPTPTLPAEAILQAAPEAELDPLYADNGTTAVVPAPGKPEDAAESAAEPEADADAEPDDDTEPEAPGFVQRAERRERLSNLAQVTMIVLLAVLIPLLVLQSTYYWRNQIAAAVPAMRPMLNGMCATFHCTVGLPADIDRLSLESNELQVVPPNQNIYALSLVLRNRDSGPQAWPAIELTLNNDDEKPVVRRVFRPRDYLANPAQADAGLPGLSEQQLKITFELDNALVSGYRIYLFYP